MNDKFLSLPEEKQAQIINGALKVFGKYGYKKAATDEITQHAGISKGLLYHYFPSKKVLYLELYAYCLDYLMEALQECNKTPGIDFIALLQKTQLAKIAVLKQHPFMYEFVLKAYYETSPEVASWIQGRNQTLATGAIGDYFAKADCSKFKQGIDLEKAINILWWCADGFMKHKVDINDMDMDRVSSEFEEYLFLLKTALYKEEYL